MTFRYDTNGLGVNFNTLESKQEPKSNKASIEDFKEENKPIEDRFNYIWRLSTIIYGTPDLSDEEVKELIRRSGINPDQIMNPPLTSDFSTFRKNLLYKKKLREASSTKH